MASKRWAWITAIAVLVAGISNAHAHVHLCFDGQEPPAAVHLVDDTGHLNEHAADSHHDDVDVDLQSQATLAKNAKHDLVAIDAAVAWTLAFEAHTANRLPTFAPAPPFPAPLYSHPSPRAPPR